MTAGGCVGGRSRKVRTPQGRTLAQARRRKPTESGTERKPPPADLRRLPAVRVKRWGKSPPASRRRGGLPNPVRCKANRARHRGCPPRARVAAKRDGHPRQNPAYRPATEKALETGLFLWTRFAGDSSGSLRGGLESRSADPVDLCSPVFGPFQTVTERFGYAFRMRRSRDGLWIARHDYPIASCCRARGVSGDDRHARRAIA